MIHQVTFILAIIGAMYLGATLLTIAVVLGLKKTRTPDEQERDDEGQAIDLVKEELGAVPILSYPNK